MIAPDPADRLTAGQAADRLGVSEKSVRRWMRKGVRLADGRTARLASLKVGHARVTCGTWLAAFLAAQNPPDPDAVSAIRGPAELRREAARERKQLAAIIGR